MCINKIDTIICKKTCNKKWFNDSSRDIKLIQWNCSKALIYPLIRTFFCQYQWSWISIWNFKAAFHGIKQSELLLSLTYTQIAKWDKKTCFVLHLPPEMRMLLCPDIELFSNKYNKTIVVLFHISKHYCAIFNWNLLTNWQKNGKICVFHVFYPLKLENLIIEGLWLDEKYSKCSF